jgi:hypothetical protein
MWMLDVHYELVKMKGGKIHFSVAFLHGTAQQGWYWQLIKMKRRDNKSFHVASRMETVSTQTCRYIFDIQSHS